MTRQGTIVSRIAAVAFMAGVGCSSSSKGTPPSVETPPPDDNPLQQDAGTPAVPFHAVAAAIYVAKVKNVLVGLAPTDEEIKQVQSDPTKLKALISGWMQLPQYGEKMKRFFELAFQQTQVSAVDFADQAYPKQIGINNTTIPLLIQNAQQSFARTMLQLIAAGHPLTEGMTTTQLMMTTAMK